MIQWWLKMLCTCCWKSISAICHATLISLNYYTKPQWWQQSGNQWISCCRERAFHNLQWTNINAWPITKHHILHFTHHWLRPCSWLVTMINRLSQKSKTFAVNWDTFIKYKMIFSIASVIQMCWRNRARILKRANALGCRCVQWKVDPSNKSKF